MRFNNIRLNSLPRFSFTAKDYAVTRALLHVQSFPLRKYLIISDAGSILDSLVSNPFLTLTFLLFPLAFAFDYTSTKQSLHGTILIGPKS